MIWHQPTTLIDLFKLKQSNPNAIIIAGCTSSTLKEQTNSTTPNIFVSCKQIVELRQIRSDDNALFIGAAFSLNEMQQILVDYIDKLPGQIRYFD
jgi:xanthine dehydrogenase/oxidase